MQSKNPNKGNWKKGRGWARCIRVRSDAEQKSQ
jgi:hypothetical protein